MTTSIRVLHVDDDGDFAELTAEFLATTDDRFDVHTALRASDGLERLRDEEIDCIVSDYQMPGMDGLEFLEAVRESNPELPFILFTGKGSEEVGIEAVRIGATDYLQKQAGTEQYELLANRITNAVEQYRSRQRAGNLERIRRVVREANQALVRADSREEIEQRICDLLSDSDPYRFAWIGEVAPDSALIEPRASAGVEAGYLDEITVTADESPTGQGPGGTAIRERRIAVAQDVTQDPDFSPWETPASERGFEAVAGVPLAHEESVFGVLLVYANRTYAFDDQERALLAQLGEDISHALHHQVLRRELRRERERFENLVDGIEQIALYLLDAEGRVVSWNRGAEQIKGYAEEDVLGADYSVFFPEEAVAEGRPAELLGRAEAEGTVAGQGWRVREDGSKFWADFTLSALYEESGDLRGFAKVTHDTTDQREREQELERYERIVQASGDAVYILDPDGHITFVNDALPRMVGYPEEELIGAHLSKLVDDSDIEAGESLVQELLTTDEVRETFELTMHTANGGELPVENHFAIFTTEDGHLEGTVSIVRDISDRKARERELERQNSRLEEFAGVVSHDLRNPLNVARSGLELAQEDCESDALETVDRSLARMATLIEDLLALTKEGGPVTDPEPTDLAATVDDCWRNVATADATVVADTDRALRADPGRLKRLLENLIRNAVDHGGAAVTVTVGGLEDGFYVADDGPGIPADERDRVFEAGYSTGEEGTGFGLNIVAQIAQAHGWDVAVTESREGGARFEFTGVDTARDVAADVD